MKKVMCMVLLGSLAFSLYASDWPPDSIVNGQETNYKEFTGVVGIIYDKGNGYFSLCTASLIDPEILLTAGHCVFLRDEGGNIEKNAVSNPAKIHVHNGANIEFASPIAYATTVIKHEAWDGVLETDYWDDINDLALIKLDRRITDLEIYGLRSQEQEEPIEEAGDVGTIVGYGITGYGKEDSLIHRKGTSTITDMNQIRSKSFSASEPSNTCSGDSGGPFFTVQTRHVISGITSYGFLTCTGDNEYVHILSYRDWIDTTMRSLTGHGLDRICGNGILESGESCDKQFIKCSDIDASYPASKNAPCNEYCSGYDDSECSVCGDGIRSGSEVCDGGSVDCGTLGSYEPGALATCKSDCTGYNMWTCNEVVCGDGIKEGSEVCDGGSRTCNSFGDYPEWVWAPCQTDCLGFDTTFCWDAAKAVCGNGQQEGVEECDDGNWIDKDDCTQACIKTYCGDGILNSSGEECDHAVPAGYYTSNYTCTLECKLIYTPGDSDGGCSLTHITD